MKYDAQAAIIKNPQADQKDPAHLNIWIPIRSFSVVGGASRSINLNSTDEISIASEFEQARTHKNITLFVPPSNDSTAVKLVSLRPGGLKFLLFFSVNIRSGKVLTQQLTLVSKDAWLLRSPIPVGNKQALLMLEVHFQDVSLLHGKLDRANGEMVVEKI